MISIIVSTYKPDLLQQLSKNIKETVGIEYEIIAVENNAKFSICKAYNIGVNRSNYPFLCFVHEDVLFDTKNWGERLINLMQNDPTIGLIGIAGTKIRSSYPSAIGQGPGLSKFLRGNIIHWDKYKDFDQSKDKKEIEDVVCVDGVFLFSKAEVFKDCSFDEQMLTHFHGYDIDFSLQVYFNSFRVIVDRGVLLTHFSNGNYSLENTISNRKVGKKWIKKLPVATADCHLNKVSLYFLDFENWVYYLTKALKRKLKKI